MRKMGLDGSEESDSLPRAFPPREKGEHILWADDKEGGCQLNAVPTPTHLC
jgi:hypothetical protein